MVCVFSFSSEFRDPVNPMLLARPYERCCVFFFCRFVSFRFVACYSGGGMKVSFFLVKMFSE